MSAADYSYEAGASVNGINWVDEDCSGIGGAASVNCMDYASGYSEKDCW